MERHTRYLDRANDPLGLPQHLSHGGAFVVGQKHQNLHFLAAVSYQPRIRRIGIGALLQALGGTRDRCPARVAFVVAGNHLLAHTGHALHRLHTGHFTHLEVEGFDCTHDRRVEAGFAAPADGQKYREHIQPDGIVADDFLVVLVVARVGPQFRGPGANVTDLQFAGLVRPRCQQQQADCKHPQCRAWGGQRRQPPP